MDCRRVDIPFPSISAAAAAALMVEFIYINI